MRRVLLTVFMVVMFPIIAMAGWESDENGNRYKQEDGTYKKGWYQDVDGSWYYLDMDTGYVLVNTVTPDGYKVDESGKIENAEDQNMKKYENKADFEVTAYNNGPSRYTQFGYTLPVTVYYNNSYLSDGRKIEILNFEISKDGALFVKYNMSEETYQYKFKSTTRYIAGDESYIDSENEIDVFCGSGEKVTTSALMGKYRSENSEWKPVRAEVFIDSVQ